MEENRPVTGHVCCHDWCESIKTVQNWEQHRRNPTGAAALLTIFDRELETAMKVLHGTL